MFEITPDDIARLSDADLRNLIGLLCEAEMRSRGLPTSAVTWGGHQDAPDGGIDVRVALPVDETVGGFVPRCSTGFQVKAKDMPPSDIRAEMRPSGELRPAIKELVTASGAYIIVSSKGSTTDSALQSRREAMAEAARPENAGSLTLEFYDQSRVATWVRDHSGLVLWVKERIGKELRGWRSYGAWTPEPAGANGEYLLDTAVRIRGTRQQTGDGLGVLDGIKAIRDLLRNQTNVVRLVGLSGMGKTRLVQALFDHRVGENSLDPTKAFYTNIAYSPEPQPISLASDLIALKVSAILVIDNCASELHVQLSELCRTAGSNLSAITIEYDIREDEPEGTEVFRLEPSSTDLIRKLVQIRFPAISHVDVSTIAEFAAGNARIALALAATVDKQDTISGLTDEQLFRRIFEQRHEHNEDLMRVAQACSLVYSFQGEDVSGYANELGTLGALVDKKATEMYRGVAELRRRDLVQRRGAWRAVLPHAIANRLAASALQEIPIHAIESQLVNEASERLLTSFSRRLGYLHNSTHAQAIARKWLSAGELLGDVTEFNELGNTLLTNIAPAAPEAILSTLERAWLHVDREKAARVCKRHIGLLRSIAYDAALFDRCIVLIAGLAALEDFEDSLAFPRKENDVLKLFSSLFYVHLSGTHAPVEQRLKVIKRLLVSAHRKERSLGTMALKAALKTSDFDISYPFEFGAHSRDYGSWPRSRQDIEYWFGATLKLAQDVSVTEERCAHGVRVAVAGEFDGLWNHVRMYDNLEVFARAICEKGFWPEGWTTVRRMVQNEFKTTKNIERLKGIEAMLRPADLVEQVRSIALATELGNHYLDYFEHDGTDDLMAKIAHSDALSRKLGAAVSKDSAAFTNVLPDLITRDGRLFVFGMGLAEGADAPLTIWQSLKAQWASTPEPNRKPDILSGFLHQLSTRDDELRNRLLDQIVDDKEFAAWYPRLQATASIDHRGIQRILKSLELGTTPISSYRYLAGGGVMNQASKSGLRDIILAIANRPEGFEVAVEILSMQFRPDDHKSSAALAHPDLVDTGRRLLTFLTFTKQTTRLGYSLGQIIKTCLAGEGGAAMAKEICHNLAAALSKYDTYAYNHSHLLEALFTTQPTASLDGLLGNASTQPYTVRALDDLFEWRTNPLDLVPTEVVTRWCDGDPLVRYPMIAEVISLSRAANETSPRKWTGIALAVIDKSPDRVAVVRSFVRRLVELHSWSGSRASAIEMNTQLLDELLLYPDRAVVDFVTREKVRIAERIDAERRTEETFEKQRDERFE